MTHRLEKGCALVITGPQGSGKSTLAREIAAAYGEFVEIHAHDLESPFGLAVLMDRRVATVIVDEVRAWPARDLKSLVTSVSMEVHSKGRNPIRVPTPNFIFITHGHRDALATAADNLRRFTVIRTDEGATT